MQLPGTVAAELGPNGIRCNAVAPASSRRSMTARNWTNPDGTIDEEEPTSMI
jgi:NAD(P)-dependent dehydrogenase (short-subunit alcohol dehydrogenase family)